MYVNIFRYKKGQLDELFVLSFLHINSVAVIYVMWNVFSIGFWFVMFVCECAFLFSRRVFPQTNYQSFRNLPHINRQYDDFYSRAFDCWLDLWICVLCGRHVLFLAPLMTTPSPPLLLKRTRCLCVMIGIYFGCQLQIRKVGEVFCLSFRFFVVIKWRNK